MKFFLKTSVTFMFIVLFGHFSAVKIHATWFKHFGGSENDRGSSIQQTTDGGYIVAGHTASFSYGGYDIAIYKLDSNGDK